MKLFTCTDHVGMWPVPVASVVVAEDEASAQLLLSAALDEAGLSEGRRDRARRGLSDFTLTEVDATKPGAVVLSNGEY